MTRKKRAWLVILGIVVILAVYFVVGIIRSLYLESSYLQLSIPSRTGQTATVRVAQVSDLHLAVYGEANQELVDLVASKSPDVIVATGDMIDNRAVGIEDTLDLFTRLARIAPVVYSLGNHELDREDLGPLLIALEGVGVRIAHNNVVPVYVNGIELRIAGIYRSRNLELLDDDRPVDILLCHLPSSPAIFAAYSIPLTFSGHTHGGQFRIPFFDIALYAPLQGLFPKYTKGLYEEDGGTLIVSRGLGNSSFPFRVHNPPEVVIVDITYTNP